MVLEMVPEPGLGLEPGLEMVLVLELVLEMVAGVGAGVGAAQAATNPPTSATIITNANIRFVITFPPFILFEIRLLEIRLFKDDHPLSQGLLPCHTIS